MTLTRMYKRLRCWFTGHRWMVIEYNVKRKMVCMDCYREKYERSEKR